MQSVRDFLHYFFSILLWILFGYYWYVVSGHRLSLATFHALGILVLVSLLGLVLTLLWVRHNQNIARNNRRGSPAAPPDFPFTEDHLGRPISGPGLDVLRTAHVISIDLDEDGHKVYAASGEGSVA